MLSAGIRFGTAGAGLLLLAKALQRPLQTDATLAVILGLLPFATAYGLIYWGEQYVPSGLAAVLFGVMPLYRRDDRVIREAAETSRWTRRLILGIVIAICGLDAGVQERA